VLGISYGMGKLWKAVAALLLALVVSLGTLGVAQATHSPRDTKPGFYKVGGSAADRMLAKSNNGAVVATWTHVRINDDYSQRAYWTVKNTSSSPQKVGCAGYQNYGGLSGFKVQVYYHTTFKWEWEAKDALCHRLPGRGAYRQMLQPGQTIVSWADFEYSGKKGTCTKLTLPTGPAVDHLDYTKCVNPYARYVVIGGIRSPFDSSQTWYGCRGYNTATHSRNSAYALDLIVNEPRSFGEIGCNGNEPLDVLNESAGRRVYAPVSGHTSACGGYWNAQFVCVQSSSPTRNGYYFIIGHVQENSRLLNTNVQAGAEIGRLEYVGNLGLEIAHIHIEARLEPSGNSQSVQFISANGTAICQQAFPSNGRPNQYAGEPVHGCN